MQLVEYKKLMPPPAIWVLILVAVGWAIQMFTPAEYATYATMAWGIIMMLASALGVSKQKLFEVAGQIGVQLPDEPTPAAMEGPGEHSALVRPARDQKRLVRWLV
jgi:hypothetical protein